MFQCFEQHKRNSIHLYCLGVAAGVSEEDISQPLHITLKLSHATTPLEVSQKFCFYWDLTFYVGYGPFRAGNSSNTNGHTTLSSVLPVQLINRCARASQSTVAAVVSVVHYGPAVGYSAEDHLPELPHRSVTQHCETQWRQKSKSKCP